MSLAFPKLLLAAAIAGVLAVPALAQQKLPSEKWVHPPSDLPKVPRAERLHNMDFLFGALQAAPDEESAKAVENRIWALWMASGSDTADLLMTRARAATEGKDYELAVRLLSTIIELRPSYVEAWNRRATIYFLRKDYVNAMADLREVLVREPRHFGALAGVGTILEEFGDEKHALEAFRKAQAVYPRLAGVADQIKTLTEKVEGRDI